MAKAELGGKRRCLSCASPFFDLNRTPIVCPKCNAVFHVVELAHSPPRRAPMPHMKKTAPVSPAAPDLELPVVEDAIDEFAILPLEDEVQEADEIETEDATPAE